MARSKHKSHKKKHKTTDKPKGLAGHPSVASQPISPVGGPGMPPLSKEAEEKLKKIRSKLEKLKNKVVAKFDKYIMGVTLLPPPRPMPQGPPGAPPIAPMPAHPTTTAPPMQQPPAPDPNKIYGMVLIDDSDSKKMTKWELKNKLGTIINNIAAEIDKDLVIQTLILSELWQNCYDAKYDLLNLVAMSAPVYDTGMLQAIKIAEIHKSMVLRKFEKYIVSYVLAGSLVQGRATKTSDIDVWIVIDDTDVKRMTRAELKDKLRAIIIGMGIEAGELTGVKNKLNIQIYILTDFWESLKEANPVIFTLLRDGVPFYDRGIFMPWKQLLKMGKIKPSPEAIDMFMSTGDQMIKRVEFKLREIGMEDIYYALLTPSQAALMLFGVPPPAPRETPELMREIFVKKESLIEDKYIKILESVITLRKDIEHGTRKEVSGKEIDDLLKQAEDYLKRIRELFDQIDKVREKEGILAAYDQLVTVIRDVLTMEGISKVEDEEVVNMFEDKMIASGKIAARYLRQLNAVIEAKKDFEAGKLTKPEVEKARKDAGSLIKALVEYMQRTRGRDLDRVRIRVKHGERYGEVMLLDKTAFIVHDVSHEEKEMSKAPIKADGSLGTVTESSLEEFEKAITNLKKPQQILIKERLFEDLKKVFGKDVEILI